MELTERTEALGTDLLSREKLEKLMQTHIFGRSLLYLETVDSTNTEASHQGELSAPHGFLVVADRQEKGKGRRGRGWKSDAGENIYMTLLLRPSFQPEHASMITLVAALAVACAIREETGLPAMIKWPNDIVVNRKKVVGILTEMQIQEERIRFLLCGIGINVNQPEFPEELAESATSLYLEGGRRIMRAPLIAKCMEHFEEYYRIFCRKETMSELLEQYNDLLVNRNTGVRVLDPKGEYSGIAGGINEAGELLVTKEDGTIEKVYAGEVSVRGIYGYV